MRHDVYAVIYTDKAGDIRWHLKQEKDDVEDDIVLVCPDTFESKKKAKKYIMELLPGRLHITQL